MNWGFWNDHPRGTFGNNGRNQTDAMWLQRDNGTLFNASAVGMDDTRAARGSSWPMSIGMGGSTW